MNFHRKTSFFPVILFLILPFIWGCGNKPAANKRADTTAISKHPANDFPIIVTIKFRDSSIVIKAGKDGPLFSVLGASGKLLSKNISEKQMQALHPEQYQLYEVMVVGKTGKGLPVIDASGFSRPGKKYKAKGGTTKVEVVVEPREESRK